MGVCSLPMSIVMYNQNDVNEDSICSCFIWGGHYPD